ncbi:tripartite tricarboxylate transporter substrate binding protein [Ramlibacter sp.]|uniref:tripartite tricarboxylate transporter substrate binding protein n=1 Tax=Ramlibacter sp. TaxID=1917967 RepID=UPI003D0CC24E
MQSIHRRLFSLFRLVVPGLVALTAFAGAAAWAQSDYPTKPVRLVVPYPPGGFTDILGRLVAERLTPILGQPVVVDNKGGGGSTIGTSIVAQAPGDGHTILLVALEFAVNESLIPGRLTYDVRKNFTPVIRAAYSPMVLVVHPSVKANSAQEFFALAKSQPGKITYASGGSGTGSHLAMEMLKTRLGVDIVHVPYKGNGPATTDLIGGQVQSMFLQYAVAKPHIDGGKLRVLATPGGKRSAAMPGVPTIAETAAAGFDVNPWFGFVVHSATPPAIVSRLNAAIAQVLKQPDVEKRLLAVGADPTVTSPKEFADFIDAEIVRWAEVVKTSGGEGGIAQFFVRPDPSETATGPPASTARASSARAVPPSGSRRRGRPSG